MLKIKRDQDTMKESIQGIGDVRFGLMEEELKMLQRRFSLDLSGHKFGQKK
jgi:hypothetical protein